LANNRFSFDEYYSVEYDYAEYPSDPEYTDDLGELEDISKHTGVVYDYSDDFDDEELVDHSLGSEEYGSDAEIGVYHNSTLDSEEDQSEEEEEVEEEEAESEYDEDESSEYESDESAPFDHYEYQRLVNPGMFRSPEQVESNGSDESDGFQDQDELDGSQEDESDRTDSEEDFSTDESVDGNVEYETIYMCMVCQRVFESVSDVQRHQQLNTTECPDRCCFSRSLFV